MRIRSGSFAVALTATMIFSAAAHDQHSSSSKNLSQIGLAMRNFHDANRRLPTSSYKDGKPLLSWRVHILPYIGAFELYQQFRLDEAWDSEHNKALIAKMPAVYRNPSLADIEKTVYLACTGEHSVFTEGRTNEGTRSSKTPSTAAGSVVWSSFVCFSNISDGASNTIMVVEVDPDRAVIWTKPDDLHINVDNPIAGLDRPGKVKFNALFCDGTVRSISTMIAPETLKMLFDPTDGMSIPPNTFY